MANSWFQFKQFKIEQGQTAMKVGTDGVMLGAWAEISNSKTILDIGTGTGLIALMCAQRNSSARIVGIEIDQEASIQATENFNNSNWSDRLFVKNIAVQDFAHNNISKFDAIISNPPFFENAFKAKNTKRHTARHTDSLSFSDLLSVSSKLLSEEGFFSLIIPAESRNKFIEEAKKYSLYLLKRLDVYPTNQSLSAKRSLLTFAKVEQSPTIDVLIIEPEKRHQYSDTYIELTKAFYLNF